MVHTVWAWACVAVCFSAAAVVRAYAYRIRERGRRKTMTAVLQHLSQQGGFARSVDQDGLAWTLGVAAARKTTSPEDSHVPRVRNTGHAE